MFLFNLLSSQLTRNKNNTWKDVHGDMDVSCFSTTKLMAKRAICTECQCIIYGSTQHKFCTCHSDQAAVFCSSSCLLKHRGTSKPFCLCSLCQYDGPYAFDSKVTNVTIENTVVKSSSSSSKISPLDWPCFICAYYPVRANDESAIHVTIVSSSIWDDRFYLQKEATKFKKQKFDQVDHFDEVDQVDQHNQPKWVSLWNNLIDNEKDLLNNRSSSCLFYKGHLTDEEISKKDHKDPKNLLDTTNIVLCKDCINNPLFTKSEGKDDFESNVKEAATRWDVYRLLFDVKMIRLIEQIDKWFWISYDYYGGYDFNDDNESDEDDEDDFQEEVDNGKDEEKDDIKEEKEIKGSTSEEEEENKVEINEEKHKKEKEKIKNAINEIEKLVQVCLAFSNSNSILSESKRVEAMVKLLPSAIKEEFYEKSSKKQTEYSIPLQSIMLTMTNFSQSVIDIIIIYSSPCARIHLLESIKLTSKNYFNNNKKRKLDKIL